jgi:hypothetical protein
VITSRTASSVVVAFGLRTRRARTQISRRSARGG